MAGIERSSRRIAQRANPNKSSLYDVKQNKDASYKFLRNLYWGISLEEAKMTWTTPCIVEVCVGMEVNAYFPADF